MRLLKLGSVSLILLGASFLLVFGTKAPRRPVNQTSAAGFDLSALPPQAPVAVVNAVAITAAELRDELERVLPATPAHGHTGDGQRGKYQRAALEELVIRELAFQKATAMRLRPEPVAVAQTVQKIQSRYHTGQSFRDALRAEGITEQEFVHRVEKDLVLRKLYKLEIDDKATVTEAEAKQYYDANPARFARPESIHLWHIIVKPSSDRTAAKKKIDQAFRQLQAGRPFDVVAYRYSEDDYRVMGGDYGSVHRGQLAPELDKAAFAAPLDRLVGPFQTRFGWHILRVEKHEAGRQLSFEDVKGSLVSALTRKRREQRKAAFVRELKTGANIRYRAAG